MRRRGVSDVFQSRHPGNRDEIALVVGKLGVENRMGRKRSGRGEEHRVVVTIGKKARDRDDAVNLRQIFSFQRATFFVAARNACGIAPRLIGVKIMSFE